MKTSLKVSAACCLSLAAGRLATAAPAMRDVVTHEQLVRESRQSSQDDPMMHLPAATGEDPSLKNMPQDLLSQSEIICFNGIATLVPKRAVLAAPANIRGRLAATPNARIVSWSEFFAVNRGWISTEEVSFPQAAGKTPMPEATTLRIGKSSNLVVATFHGGPISVMPLVEVPQSPEPQK